MRFVSQIWLATLIVVFAACNRQPLPPPQPAAHEPKVRATVVTIQTTIQPANKTYTHTLVIANDRARSSDEVDEWRLFDFREKRVTYVDDLTKTYRRVPFAEIVASHRETIEKPLPDGMPRAQFVTGRAQKTLLGMAAKQSLIRMGAYQRELWIAEHPLIPPNLFAMMQASGSSPSKLAGVMREADEALIDLRGYPLADHAELPYENTKLIVENTVVKIEQRDVPAAFLNVNRAYNLSKAQQSRSERSK